MDDNLTAWMNRALEAEKKLRIMKGASSYLVDECDSAFDNVDAVGPSSFYCAVDVVRKML